MTNKKVIKPFIIAPWKWAANTNPKNNLIKDLKFLNYKKQNFKIIGSAHNFKEISFKIRQGCSSILLSKLFIVDYDKKAPYYGVVKFNYLSKISKKLVPLGGIKSQNLNQLKNGRAKTLTQLLMLDLHQNLLMTIL